MTSFDYMKMEMESHKMEETGLDAEKSQNMLVNLRDHLILAFPNLLGQTMPLSLIRNDTEGNISLVVPLKSRAEPTGSSTRGYVNMGLPLDTPTFMLQFIPMWSIADDEESPSQSSRTLISVTVATYHGLILKKDFFRFFITYNNPDDLQEVELKISSCDLLEKLESFPQGFRLCAGLEVFNGLDLNSVFIEPFGSDKEFVVVRSRKCEYLLEVEDLFSLDKIDLDRVSCIQCGLLQNSALCIKPEIPQLPPSQIVHEFHIDDESDHHDDIEEDIKENIIDDKDDPVWKTKATPKVNRSDFYKCGHCDKSFKTLRAKERCSENCQQKSSMKEELVNINQIELAPLKAGKKRRKRVVLNSKPKKAKGETIKKCSLCFKEFAMITRYEQHMELHKKRIEEFNTQTKCPKSGCNYLFPNREQLCHHYTSEHDPDSTPCAYCLKVLHKEKLRAHFFAEHPYKEFSCQICGKICAFQSQLKQHTVEAHSTERPKDVVCDICGNRYRREAGLRQHMASAHSDHREFQCLHPKCIQDGKIKGFTTRARYLQHQRIHMGLKPFMCKLCEYKSTRSDNVLFHCRKVHRIPKPTKKNDVQIDEGQLNEDFLKPLKIDADDTNTSLATLIVSDINVAD